MLNKTTLELFRLATQRQTVPMQARATHQAVVSATKATTANTVNTSNVPPVPRTASATTARASVSATRITTA